MPLMYHKYWNIQLVKAVECTITQEIFKQSEALESTTNQETFKTVEEFQVKNLFEKKRIE
jgi:hypothetical protein